jgi:hypothetical protein
MFNAFANLIHDADSLHAHCLRVRLHRVQTATLVDVDEIETARGLIEGDFAGARRRYIDVFPF